MAAIRKRIWAPALTAVLILAVLLTSGAPDTDRQAMQEKYANDASAFADNGAGLRVHYRDQGNPEGPAIILIHGTSASLHTWEPLVERLGDDYRIITYTQPGHGLTGPHPRRDYRFAGMAEALDLVTQELKLDHFTLGGNSMGGWISWRYALVHPEKIDALILIDAAGMPLREGETEPPLNIGFRLAHHWLGRMILERYTPRRLVEKSIYETVAVNAIVTDEMIDRYWELVRYPGNRRAIADMMLTDREPAYAENIGAITAPTLILWGEADQLIYPSAAQSFLERLPQAEAKIFDRVGHLPMEEAPDETAAAIRGFLTRALAHEENGTRSENGREADGAPS